MPALPVRIEDGVCTLEVTTNTEIVFVSFMGWLSALEDLQKLSPINSIALDRDPIDPTLYAYLLKRTYDISAIRYARNY